MTSAYPLSQSRLRARLTDYKQNGTYEPVGRPEIQKFFGALAGEAEQQIKTGCCSAGLPSVVPWQKDGRYRTVMFGIRAYPSWALVHLEHSLFNNISPSWSNVAHDFPQIDLKRRRK